MVKNKEQEQFIQECTFKPKINKIKILNKRCINDLFEWEQ